jgi:hypothetical protein
MCKHVGKSSCRHTSDTASDEPTRCNVADMVCVVSVTQRRHVGMSVVLGGKNPRHDADITSQGGVGEGIFFLVLRDSPFSISLVLRNTVFSGCSLLLFVFHFSYLFWLFVWCIILLLHPLPCSLRVSPSVSAFFLSTYPNLRFCQVWGGGVTDTA